MWRFGPRAAAEEGEKGIAMGMILDTRRFLAIWGSPWKAGRRGTAPPCGCRTALGSVTAHTRRAGRTRSAGRPGVRGVGDSLRHLPGERSEDLLPPGLDAGSEEAAASSEVVAAVAVRVSMSPLGRAADRSATSRRR